MCVSQLQIGEGRCVDLPEVDRAHDERDREDDAGPEKAFPPLRALRSELLNLHFSPCLAAGSHEVGEAHERQAASLAPPQAHATHLT